MQCTKIMSEQNRWSLSGSNKPWLYLYINMASVSLARVELVTQGICGAVWKFKPLWIFWSKQLMRLFYCRFVHNFAVVEAPLKNFLKKSVK